MLKALEICRNCAITIPFLVVTEPVPEAFAITCFRQGADDYILNSELVRLPKSIVWAIRQREHELKKVNSEKKLKKKNKRLSSINKELDKLVFSVSHNLRAPLKSLQGLVTIFEFESGKENLSQYLTQYFPMMRAGIDKLDDTIREILDYLRHIDSKINIQPINLHQLIEKDFEKVKYLPGYSSIEKKIYIENGPPLYADAYHLGVIFNNLISNGIKYADLKKRNRLFAFRQK